MPDTRNRRDDECAKYDAMSTEELQQVLREDASKPEGEESDSQALFYIMEVLAKRRKERNEGRSAAEALESFKKNYYTETETSSDFERAAVTRKRINTGHWRRGLVAAIAAICILVVGNSITASALGFDLWEIIAKWTQETFHFGYAGQTEETNAPSPEYNNPCAALQEILDSCNINASLVPTWIPDGYSEVDTRIDETPAQRRFIAKYQSGDTSFRIRIAEHISSAPAQVERSDMLLEVYSANGIEYFIFENNGQLKVMWIVDR